MIVGAGAAGLTAATRLRALGRSVLVLEGRTRVGGRVFTDRRLEQPFDAGAQYLHWAERNPWRTVAAGLGIAAVEDDSPSALGIFADGIPLPDVERRRRRQAFSRIEGLISAGSHPDRSIAEAVGVADGTDSAGSLTRMTLGEEPDRVSSADYDELWSGDDLVCPGGFGTLLERYAEGLPIRLGTPVSRVDWSGAGVALETPAGAVRARAAIVTVPVGVLQAGAIAFAPAPPPEIADALAGLGMGAYTKIALRLDPARLAGVEMGDAIDTGSHRDTMSFDIRPFGRDLVLCTLGGDYARDLCRGGEAACVDHAAERLGRIFGARARSAVAGGVLANWWDDPFSRGGYSFARPGHLAARIALRRPLGRHVWFAGEASAGAGAMTAGGAALEGERAADEVARVLGA